MRVEKFSFGSIRIDGTTYGHDVVIDRGEVRKRKKKPSKKLRGAFGHTPLSLEEKMPWKCRRLVIGTGAGALPVMKEVKREAKRQNQTIDPADKGGDQGAEATPRRYQRHLARHGLTSLKTARLHRLNPGPCERKCLRVFA